MLGLEHFGDAEAGLMHAEDRKRLVPSVTDDGVGDAANGEKESMDMNEDMDFADAESGSQSDVRSVSIRELLNSADFEDDKSQGKQGQEIIADEKAVIENHQFGLSPLSTHIEVNVPHHEEEMIFEGESGNVEDTHGNVPELKENAEDSTQLDGLEKYHDDVYSEQVVNEGDIDQDSSGKAGLSDVESGRAVNEGQDVVSMETFPSEVFEFYEPNEVVVEGEAKAAPANLNMLNEVDPASLSFIDTCIARCVSNEDIVEEEVAVPAWPEEEDAMDQEAAAASRAALDKVSEGVVDDTVAVPACADDLIGLSALDDAGKEDVIAEKTKDDVDEGVAPTPLEHGSSPVVILSEEDPASLSSIDTSIAQCASNADIVDEEVAFPACPEEEDTMDEKAAAASQSALKKVSKGVVDDSVAVSASANDLIGLSALVDSGKEDVIGEGTKDHVDEDAAPTSLEHVSSPVVIDKVGKEDGNVEAIHCDITARDAADGRNLLDSSGIAKETLGHKMVYEIVESGDVNVIVGSSHGDIHEEEVAIQKGKVVTVESQFEGGGDRNKTTDKDNKHILAEADETTEVKVSDNSPLTNSSSLVASTNKEEDSDAKHGESSKEKLNASDSLAAVPGLEASSLAASKPSLPSRPAGLGWSTPSLEHGPRAVQRDAGTSVSQSSTPSADAQLSEDPDSNENSKGKLQMIRVKFLRLANRLGQSANNVVVTQVLYRLGLAEQLRGARGSSRSSAFSLERASVIAEEQEARGQEDLDFGCTIMVLGKTGVGKSATINSLFDEVKTGTNAYMPATKEVQEVSGTVHGIRLKVIDTPGLLMSFADQRHNEKIMASVKKYIKKSPPDIVLYFDRLDMQTRDYGDLPLLRTITDTFGAAIWFNAIVVLTHASSAPPDGTNGGPVSYEMFVAQRSHIVQQSIRQAAGDMRLMNPVSLVENHAACRTNRSGQRVLPNGQVWKPQLLLLCFASKILAEANSLLKLQDNTPGKTFSIRPRLPPLPFLLSSLLQSRAPPKLPGEQLEVDDGDGEGSEDSDEDADSEGEDDYDSLPPFRRLTNDELRLLTKEQKKAYFDELEYREKLFMKKQWKDEKMRQRELKRRLAALPKEIPQIREEVIEEENGAASVPVPMPDMALPPSFDSDNPTYRYRYLETANQWLVRPVLETHGWDHDNGYDGLNVEKAFIIKKRIPASLSGQITKDKKEATVQMECAASLKMGEGKSTMAGLDVQTVGKDLACTLRSETRFNNFKRNRTVCGLSVTLLGGTIASGIKIEDRLMLGKRLKIVVNGGALTGRGNVAYGGSAEVTLRDKDYPIGRSFSTLGLSVMNWHGDLAIGGNLQVQFQVGKTMMVGRANLNNRGAGQISIRASSSEQLQMALIGLIPLFRALIGGKIFKSSQ